MANDYDTAVAAANPKFGEFFKVIRITAAEEYYTTWYRSFAFAGDSYKPVAITRDSVKYQTGTKVGQLKLNVPIDSDYITIADVVNKHVYEGAEIYLYQVDISTPANFRCLFRGNLTVHDIVENAMQIQFENVFAKLRGIVPVRSYTQQCTHRLGDLKCTAVLADLKENSSTDAGSTNVIIVDSNRTEADNHWRYGYVHLLDGDLAGEKRTVIASDQSSTNFTVEEPFSAAVGAGISYDLYPYCRKKLERCFTDHYLGFWFIKKQENIYYG